MSQFSEKERIVARLLGKFPYLKALLKNIYQHGAYAIHGGGPRVRCDYEIFSFGRSGVETFFGYYDRCPRSPDGRHLLWHETTSPTSKRPDPEKPVFIVLADGDGNEVWRAASHAYNWQQGSRLLWLNSDAFSFNDYDIDRKNYIARIVSVEGRMIRDISMPLMDVHGEAGFGVSVNFERLASLRPDYGYFNRPVISKSKISRCPSDDGLWRVDLSSGASDLVVCLKELAGGVDGEAVHKVNHPMISPDGRKCIFLHRYYIRGQRFDRLMLHDFESGAVRMLADTGMVSHMAWLGNSRIFGYMRGPDQVDGFYIVDLNDGEIRKKFSCASGDGHPSVGGLQRVVFDTYPDKARMQHLYYLDMEFEGMEPELIGSFFHGLEYRGVCRCDLHPRFRSESSEVFFDSVYDGMRRMRRLTLT